MSELWWFRIVVGMILVIPGVAGPVAGFGGLAGLEFIFGIDNPSVVDPALRNSLRAICFMFFAFAPLLIWVLAAPAARATPFRIIITCAWLAGFTRLTGYFVDGRPSVIELGLMGIELLGMPILVLWHLRLVKKARL